MLISVTDREIYTTLHTSLEKAQAQMREEMVNYGRIPPGEVYYSQGAGGLDGEYEFSDMGGWSNNGVNHTVLDWKIVGC